MTEPAADARATAGAIPRAVARRRRGLAWAGAGLAALAVAAVAVVVISGGAAQSTVSTLTLTPVQAQIVPAIHNRHREGTVSQNAPGGYEYRVVLDTIDAPRGSTARTPLPLYMTLSARRGSMPFVTVQQLKLPSDWRWTASSSLSAFTLEPQPDGSGQIAVSWYVIAGDRNDVTHYLTVGPSGIQPD